MATSLSPKEETSCQEESEVVNISDTDKKESYSHRAALYKKPVKKNKSKLELVFNDTSQEVRRQQILYHQKKNRDEVINARRGLLEDVFNSEIEEEMEPEEESQNMEVDPVKKKYSRAYRQYTDLLMLSEWMLELPQDFAEKWIMVPCPVGKRSVIVACKGSTKMYCRKGKFVKKFKSFLPGGNSKSFKNSCTILDCVWYKEKKILYILDVLAWSRQEMINCETECRFFWVRSQIQELDDDIKNVKRGYNDYSFELLPNIPCDSDLSGSLESIIASLNLDGLLFYHKEVHYTSGKTPLVVWLKPYMLPEILGINVPAPYDEKPRHYIDFQHHVLKVTHQEKEKIGVKHQRNKRQSKSEQEGME